jgi:hypothetical protein
MQLLILIFAMWTLTFMWSGAQTGATKYENWTDLSKDRQPFDVGSKGFNMGFGFLDIDALTSDIATWEVSYITKNGPLLNR